MPLFSRRNRQPAYVEVFDVADYLADAAAFEMRSRLATAAEREERNARTLAFLSDTQGHGRVATGAEVLRAFGDDPWHRYDLERRVTDHELRIAATRADDYLATMYDGQPGSALFAGPGSVHMSDKVRQLHADVASPVDDSGWPTTRHVLAWRMSDLVDAAAADAAALRETTPREAGERSQIDMADVVDHDWTLRDDNTRRSDHGHDAGL